MEKYLTPPLKIQLASRVYPPAEILTRADVCSVSIFNAILGSLNPFAARTVRWCFLCVTHLGELCVDNFSEMLFSTGRLVTFFSGQRSCDLELVSHTPFSQPD